MRAAIAVLFVGVALAGAVYLSSLHLHRHAHFYCSGYGNGYGSLADACPIGSGHWVATRAAWQIPVSILIATIGLAGALVVLRRRTTVGSVSAAQRG